MYDIKFKCKMYTLKVVLSILWPVCYVGHFLYGLSFVANMVCWLSMGTAVVANVLHWPFYGRDILQAGSYVRCFYGHHYCDSYIVAILWP